MEIHTLDYRAGVTGFSSPEKCFFFISFHLLGAVAAASNRVSQHFFPISFRV